MKVVIAGGTGFIGQYLTHRYRTDGHEVFIVSRQTGLHKGVQVVTWDNEKQLLEILSNADLLINMAGKSVDCRYNEKNKRAILASRIDTTRKLSQLVKKMPLPPKVWINSSTATIYRDARGRPMTETSGDIGEGFSVDVAEQWEDTFFKESTSNTRKVALRAAIVLGQGGGAYEHFKMLAKIGFGGPQGSGSQMMSFVHVEDVYGAIEFIRQSDSDKEVFNVSAPNPVTNRAFMKTLREMLGVRVGLRIYSWMLAIGAFVLRTETELLLKSRWVIPERLNSRGFDFKYQTIQETLSRIMSGKQNTMN